MTRICFLTAFSRFTRVASILLAFSSPLQAAPTPAEKLQSAGTDAEPQVVSSKSLLYVQVYRDTGALLSGAAHDHVIRAWNFKGSLAFDEQNPKACRLSLSAEARNLRVDEPWMRKKVGYADTLSKKDRQSVRENMLAEDQLHATRFRFLRITAAQCQPLVKEGTFRAVATIQVRGKTKTTPVIVRIWEEQGRLRAEGNLRLTHADFGFRPYSAFLGTIKNAKHIDFTWSLTTVPQANAR